MKLGIAKSDRTYCVNSKCSAKGTCEKHQDRWNFDKSKLYSFSEFSETACIHEKFMELRGNI